MRHRPRKITIEELNELDADGFVDVLGEVFEHSAWVAAGAFTHRPFHCVGELHRAMQQVVIAASAAQRLSLLRAHPELAGKVARSGEMAGASALEQSSAGLDRLDNAQFERFGRLNAAYVQKFGFPFIIAVRFHDTRSILDAFEARLKGSVGQETKTAMDEVFKIARLRLASILEE